MNGIVYPIRDRVSAGVYWFNQHVLDGVVNGAASVTRRPREARDDLRPHA